MSGRNRNKKKQRNDQIVKYECGNISEDRMIEIHTQAYYNALKKIEKEKEEVKEPVPKKEKGKWYMNVLFVLNVLLCPWKLFFKYNKQIYDSVLVMFVFGVFWVFGTLVWLVGCFAIMYGVVQGVLLDVYREWPTMMGIGVTALFGGSILIISGEAFSTETDSNKIYAYSASVIALISCIIAVISLISV